MVAVAVFLALVVPVSQGKDKELSEAAKKELKKFDGKWRIDSLIADGTERHTPDDGDETFFVVKGGKFTLGELELFEVVALDTGTDPRCIDLKGLGESGVVKKGAVSEGVYKLDGETLTIAVNFGRETNRPVKLESEKGGPVVVVTLKRVKE